MTSSIRRELKQRGKREGRERERARRSCYFRVTVDFICQIQRERERVREEERDKGTSVVNTYASNGFTAGNIFCPMWNVARRGVTFRSTLLVPDIRCQLHFATTLCGAIHHNALSSPDSWTVSLSDERAYTLWIWSPIILLHAWWYALKLLSRLRFKLDAIYQYPLSSSGRGKHD